MADWYAITDAQVDPDAPLTSELAYAWRDNPIAIAEGALGAPKVDGVAFGQVFIGLQVNTGSGTTGTLFSSRAGLLFCNSVIQGATSGSFSVRYTNDSGANWGAWQTITGALIANNASNVNLFINTVTGSVTFNGLAGSGVLSGAVSTTVPANCNGIGIRPSGGSAELRTTICIIGGRTP